MNRAGKAARPAPAPAHAVHARAALAALAAATLPFFLTLPPWIAAAALALLAWRYLVLHGRLPAAPTWLRLLLMAAALGGVIATFQGLGGAEAGGSFLVLTSALKALESRSSRDFRVVTLTAVMLVAAGFLLTQSLPLGLYSALVIWLCTEAGLSAGSPAVPGAALARRSAGLLLAALPAAAVLFLLFPRLPGPLFRFGAPQSAAVTGLADRLEPGSIAELAASDDVAFRVRFDGPAPAPAARYFRGPTFTAYDGRRWLPAGEHGAPGDFRPRGAPVRYEVLERSNGTRYLFALALPREVSTQARLGPDFTLRAPQRLWNDIGFTGVSYPHYLAQPTLPPSERSADLALPHGADPRARALAARWRAASGDPAAIVRRALRWFHDQPYFYTLAPPLLSGPDRIDQFLFRTRRGFCEHYAGAFAFLMRAAGVPARVVTGYAGGEINPYDGWLVVRQSNAHAWDEVWLGARGWIRVDPTAEIPPARVEASARAATAAVSGAATAASDRNMLSRLRALWDAADTLWAQYVVGYGPGLQHRLLQRLGLGAATPLFLALVMIGAAGAAGLIVFAFGLLRPRRRGGDPARRIYERWCRRLARRGLVRRPHEGPLAFLSRIGVECPALYAEAERITELYVLARYAGNPQALAALRRRLGRWRLRPAAHAPEAAATDRPGR